MRFTPGIGVFLVLGFSVSLAAPVRADEPVTVDDQLVFPKGTVLPRYLTEEERRYLERHPLEEGGMRAVTAPPSGPVHCASEYEPMDGILISWMSFTSILSQMAARITNEGAANVYVVVDSAGTQTSATTTLTNAGCNMSRVKFIIRSLNSVWIRDYGPRYIYEGQCRAIIDHKYNRPRPLDDAFPSYFSTYKHHAYYELGISPNQLIHGGGNYHLDSLGRSYCTRLVDNENNPPNTTYSWTESQIHGIWSSYQGVDTTFFDPFPTSVDSTQHLDMWMEVIADNKVVVSDWPNNAGSTQDIICDNAAVFMANRGYTVYRVPAYSISGVHYTFTNMVMCNNIVLLPSYTNATVSPHNAEALTTLQGALPGKTIFQINCQSIIPSAGAMHCIAMHVPVSLGGANPTVYLKNLRGGDVLTPGSQVNIQWISDDDKGVSNVDVLYSTDGGATFPNVIANAAPDTGSYVWTVPNVCTNLARVRVLAHDADGNTGYDQSERDMTVPGTPPSGDMNCDCFVDLSDVDLFVTAIMDPPSFSGCDITKADMNGDTFEDAADIQGFVDAILP